MTQGKISTIDTKDKGLGSSGNRTDLRTIFATSPIYLGEVNDDERKILYQSLLDGEADGNHYGLGQFNLDYIGAPDMSDVKTGGAGSPASPYVPNPTSPGAGNGSDPSKQEEAPEGFGTTASDTPYSGHGVTLTPRESSNKISQQTLGSYISNRSFEGSQ